MTEDDTTEADRAHAARRGRSFARELPVLLVVALVLALLIKTFFVQAFFIPSGSMEQTLHGCPGCTGDRVLVNKVVHDVREVHRGEIVVFDGEGSFGANADVRLPDGNPLQQALRWTAGALGAGSPGRTDYVKRVIGIGGDRVACCSANGRVLVTPAGSDRPVELIEPYVFEDDRQPFCAAGRGADTCPPGAEGVLVPDGRVWVMGDHRGASSDSRAHLDNADRGTVAEDRIIGRAFVIVWPLSRAAVLEVPSTFDGELAR